MLEALNDFKSLNINKLELQAKLGQNLHRIQIEYPVVVSRMDVTAILKRVKRNEISVGDLVDWVNIIWFTDLFVYADEDEDAIASVMSELEELDEPGVVLTAEKIDAYIDALQNNREI